MTVAQIVVEGLKKYKVRVNLFLEIFWKFEYFYSMKFAPFFIQERISIIATANPDGTSVVHPYGYHH